MTGLRNVLYQPSLYLKFYYGLVSGPLFNCFPVHYMRSCVSVNLTFLCELAAHALPYHRDNLLRVAQRKHSGIPTLAVPGANPGSNEISCGDLSLWLSLCSLIISIIRFFFPITLERFSKGSTVSFNSYILEVANERKLSGMDEGVAAERLRSLETLAADRTNQVRFRLKAKKVGLFSTRDCIC